MISSRTPGGTPNRCPLCDAAICVEPTEPPGDAPCPNCGTLLWFSKAPEGFVFYDDETVAPIREWIIERVCENLGVNKDQIDNKSTFLDEMGTDSLDFVELVMELEEEFEITIPDEDAVKIKTFRDLVDYILRRL